MNQLRKLAELSAIRRNLVSTVQKNSSITKKDLVDLLLTFAVCSMIVVYKLNKVHA